MLRTSARVKIRLPQRSYEAVIQQGLLNRAGEHLRHLLGDRKRLFLVTVAPVRQRWAKKLTASLAGAGFSVEILEMRDGETYKRLDTVERLAEKLAQLGADRNAVVVAFGGGVVGDVAGFLASSYMRGIDVIQVPTTVQAQLDAAIGGKTGVNLRAGKNLFGAFHQPLAVLIDTTLLSTLPERELRAGLYEALKCGVIGRPKLFERLRTVRVKELRRVPETLEWVISESVKLKARVVSSDEREGGLRRILNFGHTIGHALEADSQYKRFLHGEAVAWGMIAATRISNVLGYLDPETAKRIIDTVLGFGPLPRVAAKSGSIVRRLQADKKTSHGLVHFVLPTGIGKVKIVNDVPERVIIETVDELRNLRATDVVRTKADW
jgi:3-dehydroquinate synthase